MIAPLILEEARYGGKCRKKQGISAFCTAILRNYGYRTARKALFFPVFRQSSSEAAHFHHTATA
jgi:hypothetical protein